MTEKLVLCGATTVIGFNNSTIVGDCNNFAQSLSYKLIHDELSVEDAINSISYTSYTDDNFGNLIEIAGNSDLTLR